MSLDSRAFRPDLATILWRAVHPPIREGRFWAVQAMLLLLAALHIMGDSLIREPRWLAAVEIPIALAIIPVVYSALQYGLVGSGATSIWAVVLWLPDLLFPDARGHPYSDMVSLSMVVIVGVFVGFRIESERLANARARRASAGLLAAEARYRQLFEANRAPILVADHTGLAIEANPAARALLGPDILGRPVVDVIGTAPGSGDLLPLPDGREYRLDLVSVPTETGARTQVVFEDVTAERSEGRRATRYAALMVQAEEDQRRRLARELHDEPLQLFLHLARRLESVSEMRGLPRAVARDLERCREQSLEAAGRLRSLARDLRPPTLDQLGLVAAVSSLVADIEDEGGPVARLEVTGEEARLAPDVELGAFRIVQEAVRNTLNHARARHLGVSIAFEESELAIRVADDGCGFPSSGTFGESGPAHLGLVGMAERARLLGGELELQSAPSHGTAVSLRVRLGAEGRGPGRASAALSLSAG